ncbi:retrovirus-related pol polyprotein from transposon TNT 1-94 [Tanacetum coccineum]|uniref:Retrovirus-related pol polyprotein from transposon TNT 1-94 n=1 Tax=Tanacetum coccineum TaxID=301880 RepID=A0ABQ5CUZ3_9ASTR
MEAAVDRCSVDKNTFEIQIKQLSIDNDQPLKQIMSQEIVHIAVNYVDILDVKKSCVKECNKCLELETELLKKKDLIEKDVFAIAALKNELRKLKGKNDVNTAISKPSTTIAPGMFKLEIEPISHRLKNNKDAHEVYLEKTIENTDTLRGLVECARKQNPSEPLLESACMFAKPVTSSCNIPKQIDSLKTKDSNKPFLTSIGVKPTTSASGSKPSGNTKNNRITQPPSSNKKNNVEDHSRKVKSSLNKMNFISEPTSNAHVKHYVRDAKFKSICAICNKCLFDANHDMCVIDYVNDVNVVQIVLWYLDSGCSKHMTENRSQLINFVSKFLGTVRFRNDHIAKIMGYGDYQMGNVTISQIYYVEGLGHNLFSVGQFCDFYLEVAFCKHTCFIRDLDGVDLLNGIRSSNLYNLSMDNLLLSSPICLLSKALNTKSWLWHRRLSYLNFDYITSLVKHGLVRGLPKLKYQKDHLCSACALVKNKSTYFKANRNTPTNPKLKTLSVAYGSFRPMRIRNINRRKYILVIVDDYSRFTWVKFLRSKDEVPEFVIKFLKMIQVHLNATVHNIRTNNGIEFVNQTLKAYYKEVRISHQTSVARTP